jgi:hypothetical protein
MSHGLIFFVKLVFHKDVNLFGIWIKFYQIDMKIVIEGEREDEFGSGIKLLGLDLFLIDFIHLIFYCF